MEYLNRESAPIGGGHSTPCPSRAATDGANANRVFDSASPVRPAWLTPRERYNASAKISQRFETVRIGEFTTPPRVCGGVLVDRPGSLTGCRARRAKCRDSKHLRRLCPKARALCFEPHDRHPDPNPGGSDRPIDPNPLKLSSSLVDNPRYLTAGFGSEPDRVSNSWQPTIE